MSSAITDRLKKLIAHEASARNIGSASEAEAFAAKIQEMLITHKLSLSDIERDAEEAHEPIQEEAVTPEDTGLLSRNRPQREMVSLAETVARGFFCRTVITSYSNTIYFVGRESNRRAAVDLYKLLAVIAKRTFPIELSKWKKTADYKFRPGLSKAKAMEFKYGYFLGFIRTIQLRFMTTQKNVIGSGGTGMVLVNKMEKDVELHMQKYRVSKPTKARHFSNAGIAAGEARAQNISLTSRGLL